MGKLIYISGLSGSGKTTLGYELHRRLPNSIFLDGDVIRTLINNDLGFTRVEKIENIRRNNAMIKMLYEQRFTIVAAFMASIAEERDKIFDMCPSNVRVQLTAPLEVCIQRDTKGYYRNRPDDFAGLTAPYIPLPNPHLELNTNSLNVETCLSHILEVIKEN